MLTGMELNFEDLEMQNLKKVDLFFVFFVEGSKTLVTV